jgi:hypothetical protein
MRTHIHFTITALGLSLVTACGGGGNSTDNSGNNPNNSAQPVPIPSQVISPEGAWLGSLSTGFVTHTWVLNNQETWSIFGSNSREPFTVFGFQRFDNNYKGDTLSGTGIQYFNSGAVTPGNYKAKLVPLVSLNGNMDVNQDISFTSRPFSVNYNYNRPADMSLVEGNWTGTLLGGALASIYVYSFGYFTGNSGACYFSGNLRQHSSGKNVFTSNITFQDTPCPLSNTTLNGVAFAYPTSSGKLQLMLPAVSTDASVGTVFFAQR